MPERTLLSAPFWAAALAGLLQVSVMLTLAIRMKPSQLVGAFFVSTISGGLTTAILTGHFHVNPTLAGAIGGFSGAVPAVVIPLIVLRYALKRADLTMDDLVNTGELLSRLQPGAEKPSPTTPPDSPQEEVKPE